MCLHKKHILGTLQYSGSQALAARSLVSFIFVAEARSKSHKWEKINGGKENGQSLVARYEWRDVNAWWLRNTTTKPDVHPVMFLNHRDLTSFILGRKWLAVDWETLL